MGHSCHGCGDYRAVHGEKFCEACKRVICSECGNPSDSGKLTKGGRCPECADERECRYCGELAPWGAIEDGLCPDCQQTWCRECDSHFDDCECSVADGEWEGDKGGGYDRADMDWESRTPEVRHD